MQFSNPPQYYTVLQAIQDRLHQASELRRNTSPLTIRTRLELLQILQPLSVFTVVWLSEQEGYAALSRSAFITESIVVFHAVVILQHSTC